MLLEALVGDNDRTVANSYADGHLDSYHHASPNGYDSFTGGLVGDNSGSIAYCYASTVVTAPPVSGGLVGWDSKAGIASSYFLLGGDGGPDNGLGVALMDAQMRQRGSFAGWDFESVWTICEGQDYPRLRWEDVDCGP